MATENREGPRRRYGARHVIFPVLFLVIWLGFAFAIGLREVRKPDGPEIAGLGFAIVAGLLGLWIIGRQIMRRFKAWERDRS